MKINKLAVLLVAVVMGCFGAMAQNSTLTPYSKYGYGMLDDNASSGQRGMGGVGYAMNSGRQVNVMNPASYAAIDSLTFLFDMGVDFKCLWQNEGSTTESNFTGGLDYITMAFPLGKRVGMSVGLLPYSSTGYVFSQDIDNGTVSRTGSGDINQLYAGLGVMPFKNAYIGANVAYMFGSIVNSVYATTSSSSTSLFERYMTLRDWRVDIGLQYNININKNNRATIGLTYSPGKSFHGDTYGVYYDATSDSEPLSTDTLSLKHNYTMAATYGAGISYTWSNRLLVEADFTYQPWKDAKFAAIENFETTEFDNRWKVALGAQYTPQLRGSYLQRVQYRAGVYFNHDYLMIRGNNVREYGASLGLGLPVAMFKTIVNLGFEYKHRQAHPTPLVKEQYFCITLGVNFNEMWFRKSKIY